MNELLQAAFSPVNLVYSVLLILVLLYWFSVILGALDINSVDFDLDIDADLDVDIDGDIDGEVGGWFAGALQFFNFGKMPFMVIMSFAILFTWVINLLMNHYLGHGSSLFAVLLLIPNLFVALCITKMITTPLIPIFKQLNTPEENVDYVGMTCQLLIGADENKKGQAEVLHKNRSLLIYVKVDKGDAGELKKGELATIVRPSHDENYYYIRKSNETVF